jgi:hypothetical protein
MKKFTLPFLLCLLAVSAFSQTIMYVNADTLGMKEFPDKTSKTLLYLHAPCKVMVDSITDKKFRDYKDVLDNWVSLKFFISDGSWTGGTTVYGYLPKKYLSNKLSMLDIPADTTITMNYTPVPGTNYPKLEFHKSSMDQCYYYNSFRRKEYVSANYCN